MYRQLVGPGPAHLLIAAVRFLYGTPETGAAFVDLIHGQWPQIAEVVAIRSTQTNEPARCATLLPVLAGLRQPLALLEIGAAAGLCLQPDRYAYDFDGHRVSPSVVMSAPAPVFRCHVDPATPLPERNVDVAWRRGLDLHPVDVCDEAERRWLEPQPTDFLLCSTNNRSRGQIRTAPQSRGCDEQESRSAAAVRALT